MSARAYVRARVCACAPACVPACACACVCVCVCGSDIYLYIKPIWMLCSSLRNTSSHERVDADT